MKYRLLLLIVLSVSALSCTRVDYEAFATITGMVVDEESNEPLPMVDVTLMPTSKMVQTKNDGCFEYSKLDPGQYNVWAQKDGYKAAKKDVNAISGETANVVIKLKK